MEKMIREQCANLPAALAWYLLSMLINSRLLCNFNTVPWLVLSKRSVYAIPDFWSLVLEHVFSPVNFSNYIDGGLRIVQSAYLLRISLRQWHPVIHPHSIRSSTVCYYLCISYTRNGHVYKDFVRYEYLLYNHIRLQEYHKHQLYYYSVYVQQVIFTSFSTHDSATSKSINKYITHLQMPLSII